MGGFATGSKDGESGAGGGGALDEISSGNGGMGPFAGPGPGGLPGAGGGMAPGDQPGGGTGGGGAPGGPSDPFGGAGGTGGGGAAPSGGGSECSGGTCSSDTPSGFLIGRFHIHANLFVDPSTQGGNCNSLFPPPGKKRVCRYVRAAAHSSGLSFASLWMSRAWALPRQQDDIGNGGGDSELPEGEWVCEEVPFQPPIDPALIPRIVLKSAKILVTGDGHSETKVNDVSYTPQCGTNGQWTFQSPLIKVHLSPYPNADNNWPVQIDALYPQDGTWTLKGSRTVTMHCGWDPTGAFIQCQEKVASLQGEVLANPVQGNVLSR